VGGPEASLLSLKWNFGPDSPLAPTLPARDGLLKFRGHKACSTLVTSSLTTIAGTSGVQGTFGGGFGFGVAMVVYLSYELRR